MRLFPKEQQKGNSLNSRCTISFLTIPDCTSNRNCLQKSTFHMAQRLSGAKGRDPATKIPIVSFSFQKVFRTRMMSFSLYQPSFRIVEPMVIKKITNPQNPNSQLLTLCSRDLCSTCCCYSHSVWPWAEQRELSMEEWKHQEQEG